MKNMTLLLCSLAFLVACRGEPSRKPPIHLNQNMDLQDKYKPQRASSFFEDGRTMRPAVKGTVGQDLLAAKYGVKTAGLADHDDRYLREDSEFWRGLDKMGNTVDALPASLKVDQAFMKRGQDRYGIYCTPCHGDTGYGDGLVSTVGKINVPSYHDKYKRELTAGHIFGVISNGSKSGLMQGYKHQIPAKDRWAIVAYVRALQRSQYADKTDLATSSKEVR